MSDLTRRIAQLSAAQRALLAERLEQRRLAGTSRLSLTAYVVPQDGQVMAEGELRQFLRERLPDYMVPEHIVWLDELPLTTSGKLDRKQLAARAPRRPGALGSQPLPVLSPLSPVEEVVASVWRELLGGPLPGRDSHFFELGGHSLLATRVVSRLGRVLGVELPLRALFEAPTVAGLAARAEALLQRHGGRAVPRLAPRGADEAPVSFGQERLWLLDRLEPASAPAYNLTGALRLTGQLDVAALHQALSDIVARHEVLRTAFADDDGAPRLVVSPQVELPLLRADLRGLPEADRAGELAARAGELALQPFALSRAPLLRVLLVQLADDVHVLVYALHHIAADGWSLGLLVRELSQRYAERVHGGAAAALPPLALQFGDFAAWQRGWLSGAVLEEELAFWRERLAGAPAALGLPTDRPRPAARSYRGAAHPVALPAALVEGLRALAQREGSTLFMAMLASFAALLHRLSGQSDVVVGSPIANRATPETEELIGFFVNSLALRCEVQGDLTFAALLRQARQVCLDAYAHQDVPFEKVVEAVNPARDPSRHPIFQVTLTLQNTPAPEASWPGLDVALEDLPAKVAPFELSLFLHEVDGGLAGYFVYNSDLFDEATIAQWSRHLERLVRGALAHPEAKLGELPLLDDDERRQVVALGAATASYARPGETLLTRFAAQVARTPQAVAVCCDGAALSYGELERRANQLAHALVASGAGREVLVGLLLERSLDLVVAILAVLKAGAAYLPLDPAYPPARRAFMMEDAAVRVLVTTRASGGAAGFPGQVLELDALADELAARPASPPAVQVAPSDLAYVIYTSGSTGTPKGVQVEHGNVLRLFDATQPWFGFNGGDVWTLFHSYAFDFSVWELWGALLYGGRLVVVPYLVSRSPDAFFALLLREGVTVLNQTPSAFRSLLHCPTAAAHRAGDPAMRLRWVVFGGEALELGSLAPWFERYGDDAPALVNMYGITETTVHVTFRRITRADLAARRGSLIGQPIPDLCLHLLDAHGNPVPLGVAGEICVGGAGVARGYLGRPELTAARFVASPLAPGERLYRSGDLARRTRDGELEYLGRLDHQVKIRGFRIELGEIEATLTAHPAVREATVQVRRDGGEDQRLVAYWVPEPGASVTALELREQLKEKLPPYMVPSAFVALEALPLTPEGKIHRAALPAPELADRASAAAYEAASTESEQLVAAIWQDLLSVQRVGRHDNFFELGGHSLLAIRTASRLRTALGVELPLRLIFEGQTVAEVAAGLDRLLAEAGPAAPPSSQITLYGLPITRLPPQEHYELSAYQLPEWYMYQLAPNNPFYNVSNSDEILTGDLDLDAYVRAWQTLIDRQASLRTYFDYVDGKPVQKIVPEVRLRLEDIYIDCTGVAEADVDREMRRLIDVNSCTIFDFSKAPLLVLKLAEFPGKRFLLIFATHHIIWDEICTMTVARELSILYNAYHAGREPELPPLPCEYVDFAHWINRAVAEGYLDDQRRYWLEKFRELPPALNLPTDHPRPAFQTFNGATVSEVLSPATYKKVMDYLKENNTTLYIFMLAVLNLHIYRLTGQPDFVVGTPIANRDDERLDSIVGVFATAMPMRCQIAEAMTFERLLAETRQVAVEAYENHTYPSIIAIQEINPSADLSRARLFSVMYGVQNDKTELMRNLTFDGLELTFLRGAPTPEFDRAKFDFSLVVDTFEQDINVQWTHNTDLFETSTVARMLQQLLSLIDQVIDAPGRLLTDYALLTPEQERAMVVGLNATAQPFREDACVHQLFEEAAARHPDAVALVGEQATWSYRQLDEEANRLAHQLLADGLQPEERVALVLPPGAAQVAAMLGVMKAGGAYVPIEVETPAARRQQIAETAGCRWILDEARLEALRQRAAEVPAGPPRRAVSPRALAYVLFTSGTTGVPKGIEIEHRGLVNLLEATQRAYGLGPGDTALFITPYSFDASILDVFWPLAAGARVAVPRPGDAKNPARIAELVAHHRVTFLQTVPLMLEALVAGRDTTAHGELATLRLLICGGSYLTRELCERARRAFACKLANHYGPTEVTVDATRLVCEGPLEHEIVPIGRPVDNARVYVLDGNLRPVPFNVVGEIFVGSPGLARGYLGDPELTARRFLPDPFSADPAARLYRTGDLGRFTADGNLHFVGRVDKQVKIRGNRVELEEIETCLAAHPDVRRCAVVNRKTAAGADCLVAYVERAPERGRLTGEPSSPSLFTLAQRPELRQQMDLLHVGAWPEYFLHDAQLKTYWAQLASEFAAYQLVLTDDRDEVLAVGNAVPIRWDGSLADLPRGWDDGLERAFTGAARGEAPDTLLILAGVVSEAHKSAGLATRILEAFKCLGQAHQLARVIVPVRPTEKVEHPELTFAQWCEATRDDGLLRDGWLRSHQRVGGKVLRIELASQYVKAPLADWERWAGHGFAASGEHQVAGALQPVRISLEDGVGEYHDPSVWMQHFYDRPTGWTLDDASGLREHLRSVVPDYMIPEHVRYVPVLPLAPSGKVDERALPEVAVEGAQARPFVAPSTPVQATLAAIWQELLGVAEVGILDDFYELGGHSIVAVQMLMKINLAFSANLRLQDLFKERTIKGLERRLGEEPAAGERAS